MHARVHTSGAQAAKSSIAGRRGRQGIGGIQPPLSSAPRLQAGRGGWSPLDGQHQPTQSSREARGDATRRRSRGVFAASAAKRRAAEDAQPPATTGEPPPNNRGVCNAGRGPRACAGGRAARAQAEQRRGRAYRSKDAPPRLPQRSRASSAERSASRPHGRAQRPRGREPGAQQASSKPAAPLGASEARRAGASTSPAGARLPRAAGAGGTKSAARRRQDSPASRIALALFYLIKGTLFCHI